MHVQAILDNFTEKLRSFTGRFAKANIEKAIFKGLVSSWITVMLILCLMLIVSQFRGDIESRLIDTANRSTYKTTSEEKLKIYKAVFPLIKYAEPMSKYIQDIDRDPF